MNDEERAAIKRFVEWVTRCKDGDRYVLCEYDHYVATMNAGWYPTRAPVDEIIRKFEAENS